MGICYGQREKEAGREWTELGRVDLVGVVDGHNGRLGTIPETGVNIHSHIGDHLKRGTLSSGREDRHLVDCFETVGGRVNAVVEEFVHGGEVEGVLSTALRSLPGGAERILKRRY